VSDVTTPVIEVRGPRTATRALDFIERVLIDPATGKPFVLLDAERWFLKFAFTLDADGRLMFPELIYGAIKKSGKTTFAAVIVITLLLLFGGWVWARGGDCGSTSPRALDELAQLRTHTAHHSPVMIAPLSHADWRPERSFFLVETPRGNESVRRRRSPIGPTTRRSA
jgi:hypothetical protein